MTFFQLQIGGEQNVQIVKLNDEKSLVLILNEAEKHLKNRSFESDDVRTAYLKSLVELLKEVANDRDKALTLSSFVLFPFRRVPQEEDFRDATFVESFLDALAVLHLSGFEIWMVPTYLNLKIKDGRPVGLYFRSAEGVCNLRQGFVRLVECLKDHDVSLPSGATFIILNCIGEEQQLDPENMKKVVCNILGEDHYIKPFERTPHRCMTMTSYRIEKCSNLNEVKEIVRQVLFG